MPTICKKLTSLSSSINWALLAAVIMIMLIFPKSENLAAAYGLAPGLDAIEISTGYMEILDIEGILKSNNIQEKVIF